MEGQVDIEAIVHFRQLRGNFPIRLGAHQLESALGVGHGEMEQPGHQLAKDRAGDLAFEHTAHLRVLLARANGPDRALLGIGVLADHPQDFLGGNGSVCIHESHPRGGLVRRIPAGVNRRTLSLVHRIADRRQENGVAALQVTDPEFQPGLLFLARTVIHDEDFHRQTAVVQGLDESGQEAGESVAFAIAGDNEEGFLGHCAERDENARSVKA